MSKAGLLKIEIEDDYSLFCLSLLINMVAVYASLTLSIDLFWLRGRRECRVEMGEWGFKTSDTG